MFNEQFSIHASWKEILKDEFEKDYFKTLKLFINEEYSHQTVYPSEKNIFKALNTTPFNKIKAVILGQDPYHGKNQANGLAFSVEKEMPLPPSLKNILKELSKDLSIPVPIYGDLKKWSKEGVLLLNTTLTVRKSLPNSHQNKGWEKFTDAIIKAISDNKKDVVFLIWGKEAEKKKNLIDINKHHILIAPHPSPFSAHKGFFGCKHFSKANEILIAKGKKPIDWSI